MKKIFFILIGVILLLLCVWTAHYYGTAPDFPRDEYTLVIRNMTATDIENLQVLVGRTRAVCETVPVIRQNTCYKIRIKTAEVDSEPPNDVHIFLTNEDGSIAEHCTGYFKVGLGDFALVDVFMSEQGYVFTQHSSGSIEYNKYHRRNRRKPFEKEWVLKR